MNIEWRIFIFLNFVQEFNRKNIRHLKFAIRYSKSKVINSPPTPVFSIHASPHLPFRRK